MIHTPRCHPDYGFDDDFRRRVLERAAELDNMKRAAAEFGIWEGTIHKWKKRMQEEDQ